MEEGEIGRCRRRAHIIHALFTSFVFRCASPYFYSAQHSNSSLTGLSSSFSSSRPAYSYGVFPRSKRGRGRRRGGLGVKEEKEKEESEEEEKEEEEK